MQEASITFIDQGQCGTSVIQYNSGPISSDINDNSCDDQSASRYIVPLATPYQYTISNTIDDIYWEVDGVFYDDQTDIDFTSGNLPTVTTTYVGVVRDNLGCEKRDSVTFVTSPTDATITVSNTDYCVYDDPVQLTAMDGGGFWSGPGVTNGYFYPSTANIEQDNWIHYSIGGPCPDEDSINLSVHEPPSVYDMQPDSCVASGDYYIVEFSITGGSPGGNPNYYTVIDSVSGLSAGTVNYVNGEYVFTSNEIPHNIGNISAYTFIVDNGSGCGTVSVYPFEVCGCETHAGSLLPATITICEGEDAHFMHMADSSLTDDDIFEYILSDGVQHQASTGQFYYEALATSDDTIFTHSEVASVINYGQTYYITAIAGYADSVGAQSQWHVNPEDVCYSQSMSIPVVWMENPTAIIPLAQDEVCGKSIDLAATAPTVGNGGWSSSANFITTGTSVYTDPNVTVTIAEDFGPQTFYWTVYNGQCFAKDSILINFNQTPVAYAGPDKTVCGNMAYTEAVLSTGTGGEWTGPASSNFWEETELDSVVSVNNYGTYTFTWTETYNGLCYDEDYVNITFIHSPTPDAGDNDTVCGTDYSLHCTNNLPDSIRVGHWSYTPLSCPTCAVSFDDANSPQTDIFISGNFGDSTTVMFVWYERNSVSIAPVCETTDTVLVTFVDMPFANAGDDQDVCGNTVQLSAYVDASDLFVSTWSVDVPALFDTSDVPVDSIGITGSIAGQSDPNAYLTINSLGLFGDTGVVVVNVSWLVSNLNCKVIDDVQVTFYQEPEAQAGLDETVCGYTYQFQSERSIDSADASLWTVYDGPTLSGISYIPNPPVDTN
ncbi:MAG: hypothetical protein C0594_12240, partial [Marinilabiliales bacterium]